MTLRCAIVGFGLIAERAHVDALAEVGAEVVAVVEVLEERRAAAARRLPAARIYRDVEELLALEALDFVDVCTPPHLHVAAAEAAVRAGVHALVEKPLATNLADAERLAALASRHGVVVGCVNNWTQAPILGRVQRLCRSGALGAIGSMEIAVERTRPAAAAGDGGDNWRVDPDRAGGGILVDHGWHGMALFGRSLATTPLAVRATVERRRHLELAVEDTAAVEIEYEDGARARFTATWAAQVRRNRVVVRGRDGWLEVVDDRLRMSQGGRTVEERHQDSLADGGYRAGWTAGIAREFLAEIADPARRGGAMAEALACMRLLAAAYDSGARGGRTVPLELRLAAL